MMMRPRKLFAVVGGLAAALVMSLASPAAANPNPTAYNTKTQYLAARVSSTSPTSCVSRRIRLDAGHYNWGLYFNGEWSPRRAGLYLGSDWYTWTDCLDPLVEDEYGHYSWLDPDNPNWETAGTYGGIGLGWQGGGEHTWGSYLDPQ
jgi:hypothetical protein